MLDESFKVAMHNNISFADYFTPHDNEFPGTEWLIVERSGSEGEFLTISDAGSSPAAPPSEAPAGLTENNSMFGVLLYEENRDAVFLLVRHLHGTASVPGTFFPADGCVKITETCNGLFMRTSGRHAHLNGEDVPDPAISEQGMAWHFDAQRVNWVNQSFTSSLGILYCFIRVIWPCWYCRFHWPFYRRIPLPGPIDPEAIKSIWPKNK